MNRTEYLTLCRNRAMGDSTVVVKWSGGEYIPIGYRLVFKRTGDAVHGAVLKDIKSGSCVIADLRKVEA